MNVKKLMMEQVDEIQKLAENVAAERALAAERLGQEIDKGQALRGSLTAACEVLERLAGMALRGKLRGIEGGAVLWREALERIGVAATGAAAKGREALARRTAGEKGTTE